jgi:hypothetical protein
MKSATVEMAFSPDGIMLVLVLEVSLGYQLDTSRYKYSCSDKANPSIQPMTPMSGRGSHRVVGAAASNLNQTLGNEGHHDSM